MRAGLLSQPEVIQRINETFVSTTLTYPELTQIAQAKNGLAVKVYEHWKSPVTLLFLTPEGEFISSLSPLTDLPSVHPDTSPRPGQRKDPASHLKNARMFLKHLDQHFAPSKAP